MKKIFLVLLLFSSVVFSEDVKFYNPSFSCDGVKKGSIEYQICTNQSISYLDWSLGKIYMNLLTTLSSTEQIELRVNQRDWIKNRNTCVIDKKCIDREYTNRIKYLQSKFNTYAILSNNFTYKGNPILPGCVHELLGHLNGDQISKKIDLSNCMNSNKYSTYINPPIIKDISGKEFIYTEVDERAWATMYTLKENLGCNTYELENIGYPLDGGTIISKRNIIVSLNKTDLYMNKYDHKKNKMELENYKYYEMALLLEYNPKFYDDVKYKYKKVKDSFISKCKLVKGDK